MALCRELLFDFLGAMVRSHNLQHCDGQKGVVLEARY